MAAKGGHIDFMFLAPPPYPVAGSATDESRQEANGMRAKSGTENRQVWCLPA